jgi:poly(ADP-ribose) glycohydrolase ARH3
VIRDQLTGSVLGQALGDALGFVVEARPPEVAREYVDRWLRAGRAGERAHPHFPFGQYTDDTQLARELLRSFSDCGHWDSGTFAARLAALFHEGRDVGAGNGTRSSARRLLAGVPWSESGTPAPYAGNGSAMRAGPLGLLLPDRSAMIRAAREQSRITHLDSRCAAGSVAIARAVALAAQQDPVEPGTFLADVADCAEGDDRSMAGAIRGLAAWVNLNPEAAARQVRDAGLDPAHRDPWQGISAFVIPSVIWSLYAFLRSPDDYWETICVAVAVGGDTDSMAAMAGAMSGARAGPAALPGELIGRLTDRGEWGAEQLAGLAAGCAAVVEQQSRAELRE